MLVLTRKVTEEIKIGDQIVVKLLGIKGQSVRIGIEAPRNVRVMRAELIAEDGARPEPSHASESYEVLVPVADVAGHEAAGNDSCDINMSRSACVGRPCPATRPTGRSTLAVLVRRQSQNRRGSATESDPVPAVR